jgi:anti-sigma factor RsiW
MNCDAFTDRVFDYLQGSLREDRAAFEAHRGACPACAGRLAGIRENDRILSAARVPLAPADLWPRIALAIAEARPMPFRRLRIASFLAAAAALLLVVTLIATSRAPQAPRLNLIVQEVGPDSPRAFRSMVPRYDDVDAATAMVDTVLRTDY